MPTDWHRWFFARIHLETLKKIGVHLLAQLLAGFIALVPAVSQGQVTNNEIIAFGDSITLGYPEQQAYDPAGGRRIGGYEPDLESLTTGRNDPYSVYNFGWGGETTQHGLGRFVNDILRYPKAKYVLILEGTNDIWSGLTREDTAWNLGTMADKARLYGMEPVLGTLTPDTRSGAGDYKNIPQYNTLIKAMAQDKGIVLADLYAEMVTDWNAVYTDDDLLHPNRAGYAKMAEVWFKTVFACSRGFLDQCLAGAECVAAGGYWYADRCNTYPAPLSGVIMLLLKTP